MGLELGGAGSGEAGFGRVLLVFFSGNLFVGFCDCEGALRVLVRRGSGEEGVRILPEEPVEISRPPCYPIDFITSTPAIFAGLCGSSS